MDNIRNIIEKCATTFIIPEDLFVKTGKRLMKASLKELKNSAFNPLLDRTDIWITAKQLKDHEGRCLSLFALLLCEKQDKRTFGWNLRTSMIEHFKLTDPTSRLLLKSGSFREAANRLTLMGPNKFTNLSRSYSQGLRSALRKLRVCPPGTKVKYPVRKRGYNDKGSWDPDSAWKSSRAFWLDAEDQQKIYQQRRSLQDMEELIRGFTD